VLKPGIFAVILLSFVALSAILFIKKFNGQLTPLDEIKSALGSLRATLRPGSIIGCVSYTGKPETESQAANAMVPVSVVPHVKTMDTTLFVFNPDVSDSLLNSLTLNKLWEERSANYYFVLASNTRM